MFYVYIINLKLVRQRIDGNIHYILLYVSNINTYVAIPPCGPLAPALAKKQSILPCFAIV